MRYFPAIACSQHNSPIDALISLCVPRDEVMELVVATWHSGSQMIFTRIDGGRAVAAIAINAGHWVACNAFPEKSCATPQEAQRQLDMLLKRGRTGHVIAATEAALA